MKPNPIYLASLMIATLVSQAAAVSVKDFGAVGDGATDDTAAFVQALKHIQQGPTPGQGGTLHVPVGHYKVNQNLVVTKDFITIRGDGLGSFIEFDSAGLVVDASTRSDGPKRGRHLFGFTLSHVRTKRVGTPGPAIELKGGVDGRRQHGVARWKMHNVYIDGSTGDGLRLAGAWIGEVFGLVATGCGKSDVVSPVDAAVQIELSGPDHRTSSSANAVRFFGGEIQGNATGVAIEHSSGVSFFGTSIEGNNRVGVNLRTNARTTGFYNCYFEENGRDFKSFSADQRYEVLIDEDMVGYSLAFHNCVFWNGPADKDYAIRLRRMENVTVTGCRFNGYEKAAFDLGSSGQQYISGTVRSSQVSKGSYLFSRAYPDFRRDMNESCVDKLITIPAIRIRARSQKTMDYPFQDAARGDFVLVAPGLTAANTESLSVSAYVVKPNRVRVVLNNNTAKVIDTPKADWHFRLQPRTQSLSAPPIR